jgi:AraC-like DNA-binding protein
MFLTESITGLSILTGWFIQLLSVIKIIHTISYSIYGLIRVMQVKKSMHNVYSNISIDNILWIKYILLWFLYGFIYMALCGSLILIFDVDDFFFFSNEFISILVTIWILTVWYRGLRQPEILNIEKYCDKKKYAYSKLDEVTKKHYLNRLNEYLKESRIYLNPELTIRDLSEQLKIPVMDLSQVINELGGMMFFDYINSFRVEDFITKLNNNEDSQKTFLGLALDCGFNSKSAFYTAFRKVTGKSPGQYKAGVKNRLT